MSFVLTELTHDNFPAVRKINRDDIPEAFVDTVDTIMEITDYGRDHGCLGHTFAVEMSGKYIGLVLLGEALPWKTDPPEMSERPFYRLMGFVIDQAFRGNGIGGAVLEKTIETVYQEFGPRPIALGCHRDNERAARFYTRHGFLKTEYRESEDFYYLRYPEFRPVIGPLPTSQEKECFSEQDE